VTIKKKKKKSRGIFHLKEGDSFWRSKNAERDERDPGTRSPLVDCRCPTARNEVNGNKIQGETREKQGGS